MPAKKRTVKNKAANVNVTLYEGSFDVCFDCVGTDKCAHARFHLEPPDPEDECAFVHHGGCTHAPARKAALKLISEKIAEALEEYDFD